MTYLLPLAAADRTATLWLLTCGGSTLVATLEGKTECIEKGTVPVVAALHGAVVGGGVVASGVTGFSLRYLLAGQADYLPGEKIPASQWGQVRAVDVQLQLETSTGPATEARIVRRFQQTFTVRKSPPWRIGMPGSSMPPTSPGRPSWT